MGVMCTNLANYGAPPCIHVHPFRWRFTGRPLEVPMQGLEEAPQILDAPAAAEDLRREVRILGADAGNAP